MAKDITIHELYLVIANDEHKVRVKETWIEEGHFEYNTLIEETSLYEISSKQFDTNSIESKIWERPVFWVDVSGEKWTIMLYKEEK